MLRLFALAALLSSLYAATLAYLPGFSEECSDQCSGDRDGHCPPACQDCACCLARSPVPLPATVIALVLPEGADVSPAFRAGFVPDVHPGEILHVPIA